MIHETRLCDHPKTAHRRMVRSNGVEVLVSQCLRCGNSELVKKNLIPTSVFAALPLKDDSIGTRFWEDRRESFERVREAKNQAWWDWYDRYLHSTAWQALRAQVMRRDKYTCQGCLASAATQVHHLTYDRVGHEMLFDLVAICKPCHDRIPSRRRA